MICRHGANDPACSSNRPRDYESSAVAVKSSDSPDAYNFEVIDIVQVGQHLVGKVQYPNCRSCAFEGQKVLVWLDVPPLAAVKWKKIDPHFHAKKDGITSVVVREAPSPAARFPASKEGWTDALAYAQGKVRP